jgi:hypothetical protein
MMSIKHSPRINFHDYIFQSDINIITAKDGSVVMKNPQLKKERATCIQERKDLFKEKLIQNFPITIVAISKYYGQFHLDLEKMVDVRYDQSSSQKLN